MAAWRWREEKRKLSPFSWHHLIETKLEKGGGKTAERERERVEDRVIVEPTNVTAAAAVGACLVGTTSSLVAAAVALPTWQELSRESSLSVEEAGRTSDRDRPAGWQAHMILRRRRPSYFRGKERKGCTSSDRFAAAVVAASTNGDDDAVQECCALWFRDREGAASEGRSD